jgi:cell shape-determining protein MreC
MGLQGNRFGCQLKSAAIVDRGSLIALTFVLMFLLRGLFWLVLFVVLAFSFVVLFEYGPNNFASGFQKEFARVRTFVVKQIEKVQKPKKHR